MYNFIRYVSLNEGTTPKSLEQAKLPYGRDDLSPALSEDTINLHYGKLYKGYVDRFNNDEGDAEFNEAGAFLHSLYFTQFKPEQSGNNPTGASKAFIEKHYRSFDVFKDKMLKEAMSIQGSGWVYLARNGEIKTIKNHAIRQDIVILVDWWEHSWTLDYGSDKKQYFKNLWKIVDWAVIDQRCPPV